MRTFLRGAGNSAFHRIGLLLVAALVLRGCGKHAKRVAVKAVAVGVPSLAPFFDERSGLGHDGTVRIREVPGGPQAGDTPGLYGGSRKATVCDVERLKQFLTDPHNSRKAEVWAQVEGIAKDGIPDYLGRLTPVLLRHDTLVQNHDYRNGEATPFDSLLQAGIAVLVDEQGQPAVKCSCGNPLRPFKGDTTRISVNFGNANKKWAGYGDSSVVMVTPAARRLARLALVDVDDPDRGIDRPVGTTGGHDKHFDTQVRHKVPDVTGMGFAQAARLLATDGPAVAYVGGGAPPDDAAAVTGSEPGPGTELAFGQYVTLSVESGRTAPGTGAGMSGGDVRSPVAGRNDPWEDRFATRQRDGLDAADVRWAGLDAGGRRTHRGRLLLAARQRSPARVRRGDRRHRCALHRQVAVHEHCGRPFGARHVGIRHRRTGHQRAAPQGPRPRRRPLGVRAACSSELFRSSAPYTRRTGHHGRGRTMRRVLRCPVPRRRWGR